MSANTPKQVGISIILTMAEIQPMDGSGRMKKVNSMAGKDIKEARSSPQGRSLRLINRDLGQGSSQDWQEVY